MTHSTGSATGGRRRLSDRVDVWRAVGVGIGILIAVTFFYGWANARGLRRDAGVFPTFLAMLGLGLMLLAGLQTAVRRFRSRRDSSMDDDPLTESETEGEGEGAFSGVDTGRVLRAYGSIVVFILSTMLVGFHIATPTFVVVYLFLWGGVRSWWKLGALFVSLLLLLLVVYGRFMNTPWPRSLLETTLGVDMQRFLIPYVRPLLDVVGL